MKKVLSLGALVDFFSCSLCFKEVIVVDIKTFIMHNSNLLVTGNHTRVPSV